MPYILNHCYANRTKAERQLREENYDLLLMCVCKKNNKLLRGKRGEVLAAPNRRIKQELLSSRRMRSLHASTRTDRISLRESCFSSFRRFNILRENVIFHAEKTNFFPNFLAIISKNNFLNYLDKFPRKLCDTQKLNY